MRIFHNSLAISSVIISILFVPGTAFVSTINDPCQHIKADKADRAKKGYPHWQIQCQPLVISLTWDMKDIFRRHSNYGTDKAHYVIEDSYQGFLYLVYDSKHRKKKQLRHFIISGPYPPGKAKLHSSLKSIEASFLGCRSSGRCKRFTSNRKTDFVHKLENQSFNFNWDNYIGPDRDNWSLAMSSYALHFSPNLVIPKPYAPSYKVLTGDNYPSYSAMGGGFVDNLKPEDVEGIKGIPETKVKKRIVSGELKTLLKSEEGHISPEDIKLLLDQGHLIKTFKLHKEGQTSGVSFEYSGLISTRIDLGYKKPAKLLVSPDKGFEAEMYKDGIIPKTTTYTLTNSGHEPLDFQVEKKEEWVSLSLKKGTLDPGASVRVIVSIKDSVKKIKDCLKKDTLKFSNLTNGKGDTARPIILAEVQKWQVDLNGWEWEGNRYKEITHNPQMDIRVKQEFRGEFKIKKIKKNKHCKWVPVSGRITLARVKDIELKYKPGWYFDIKDVKCINSNVVNSLVGRPLRVRIPEENVSFFWGRFEPEVRIRWRLTERGCKLNPRDCKEELENRLSVDEFQTRIESPELPLKDGFQGTFPGADQSYGKDPAGVVYIQFTYRLKWLK